jgi:hypothetical protein
MTPAQHKEPLRSQAWQTNPKADQSNSAPLPRHLTQNGILKESQRKIYPPATSGSFGEKNAIEIHP